MNSSIETHYQLSDVEFLKELSNCTLNPKLFNHEAHLRLGWILINDLGLEKAEKKIEKQLLNFGKHNGVQDLYHRTVTIVAMKILHHFMKKSKTTSFKSFIEENSSLLTDFKGLIMKHYSYDIFESEEAKRTYLKPDLEVF